MRNTSGYPVFEDEFLKRARSYQKRRLYVGLASSILEFAVLIAFLFWYLGAEAGKSANGAFLSGFAVFSLIALSKTLVSFPFDYYGGYVLAHRENLSNQSLAAWLWDRCKGLALLLLLGGSASGIFLKIMIAWPADWWWIAALASVLLVVFLSLIAPVLLAPIFFRFKPLADEELKERLLALLTRTKTKVYGGVWEMDMSSKSNTANAALVGWGPSRRVVLSDTLLDFTPDEIEAVLAHEIAHHVGRHIPALIAMKSAMLVFAMYISSHVLEWLGEWAVPALVQPGEPACVVVLWVVLGLLGAVVTPVFLVISRAFEYRCDHYSAEYAEARGGLSSALVKLCKQNLTDPDPPGWVVALFHSHPSVYDRLARIESWEKA
ncbi:MAG: M48 family metallopeptidase [Nitrospinae bacterium]|nr:M48 family metallopeptidase [Nitrospinota bacterium]